MVLPFCLPGMAGNPGRENPGVIPTRGETIRIARALLVTDQCLPAKLEYGVYSW